MTTRNYSSRSQQTTLTSAVTAGASSIVVVSGTALLGGVTIPAGTTFTIVIDPDTAIEEIVDATQVSTNTFTVTRAIDGSSAQAHSAGAVVRHMAIGRDYRESNAHIEASTGVHGISNSSSVVGTIDTQTLTNKTLTSPTITNPTISGTNVDASIVFEGATPDAFETTLTVVDPTQDNTITLPNTTGTVVIATAVQTLTNKTLTSPTISGSPVITGLSSAGMSASSATPKDYVDSILGSATAASTSAASAATSATSAATSATSAAASAVAAASSATASASSATAAATSATSAATSATAAATSATSSAASATTSQAWATQLVTPVSGTDYSAKYNANLASASATSSANSATASATSATASASSASAAATSASSAATSASSAATSATAAETAWDTFDDRYLGPKSTAPTVDNDGNPLTSGVIYWNTTDGNMYAYNGSTWIVFTSSGDITSVAAGTGLAGGGTSGAVTVSLDTTSIYVVPAQTGQSGKYLTTNGSAASWGTVTGYSAPTLGSTSIGSGATVTNVNGLTINSTTIPTSATLAKTADKLSVFAATTSAELAGVISDETGSGLLVFATSPTLTTPNIGTATGTSFNSITGLSATTPSANGTAAVGTGTTAARADHVHPTTGLGLTASGLNQFAATTSAQLAGVISDETGSGALVFGTSPTIATPTLTGTVTASGDINLSAANGPGSLIDELTLIMMGAL